MILSEGFFDVLQWVGLFAGFACAVGMRVVSGWKKLSGFGAGAALALFLAFGLRGTGDRIVIVKIPAGDGAYEKRVGRLFFSSTYVFQNGKSVRLEGVERTLVVNDSARELRITSTYYGTIGLPTPDENVPPMAPSTFRYDIDYIGPDEEPPGTVTSNIPFDIKHHLTW